MQGDPTVDYAARIVSRSWVDERLIFGA